MGDIAIFTVFRNTNYGAALQAYALSHKLEELTHNRAYLVDFIRNENTNLMHNGIVYYGKYGKKSINGKSIKKAVKSIMNYDGTVRRTKEFLDFSSDYLSVSPKSYYSGDRIMLKDLDYIFLGSDQIWNPDIVKGFLDPYFGIIDSERKRVIAYAPSLGKITFSAKEKEILKQKLKNVDVLSCREELGCSLLESLSGRKVECVLDPTLLLDKDDWIMLVDRNCRLPEKYILVYSLRMDRMLVEEAKKKAKEADAEVIVLGTGNGKSDGSYRYFRSFGPRQFLAAISNAVYVYTDSFHGTAFSILFGKQFVVKANEEKGQRMENLCRQLSLRARVFRASDEMPDINTAIDYQNVWGQLNELRGKSLHYITNAMNSD